MSYEVFCRRVSAIVKRTGAKARFSREDGKHIARCTDAGAVILMQLIGSFSVNGHKPETMQSGNKDWEVSYEEKQ